jgi:adenylate cyclase
MFLDLAGSTAIAERIGNVAFHSLLNDFFCDISRPIMDGKGDIYKYVGDEAIITWPAKGSGQSPVAAFFAIRDAIDLRADDYAKLYGEVPRFRAGLHFGEVIVGEMGLYKTEIALLGDVMNTASRIQSQCRPLGADFLASSDAMAAIGDLSGGYRSLSRGKCELRGKENAMELYELNSAYFFRKVR